VLALLQCASKESEDESDALEEKFRTGEIDVEEFIRQFTEKRVTMHKRLVD